MNRQCIAVGLMVGLLGMVSRLHASTVTASGIEPDDYASGTALTFVNPAIDLFTFNGTAASSSVGIAANGFPNAFGNQLSSVIPITSLENPDIFGGFFASTGTQSFGHAGVGFTPLTRAIGMRFNGLADFVSIDVIGRSDLSDVVGVLEAYDADGNLLDRDLSSALSRQSVETLSIERSSFEIAFAIAYSSPEFSPFGVFDNLNYVSVPEPTSAICLAIGLGLISMASTIRRGVTQTRK